LKLSLDSYKHKPVLMMGGSGLVSTASDDARFVEMLLNGGTLDGARILSPKTVALMSSNLLGNLPSINNVNGRVGYVFGLTVAVNLGIGKTGAHRIQGRIQLGRHRRNGLLDRSKGRHDRSVHGPGAPSAHA
jgi:CubicO group peptidase (beta-lactamase class C family)